MLFYAEDIYACLRERCLGITLISGRGSAILSSVKHHSCSKHLKRNLKMHSWT